MLFQLTFVIASLIATIAISLFVFHKTHINQNYWLFSWLGALVGYCACGFLQGISVTSGASNVWQFSAYLLTTTNLLVIAWWVLDLILAFKDPYPWNDTSKEFPEETRNWIRMERGALICVVMAGIVATALRTQYPLAINAALLMLAVIALAFALRMIIHPFDPTSLSGRVFVGLFRLLNRKWQWHQFPTSIAVLNLAALREDLREHNLHGTEKLPVTNPSGQQPIQPKVDQDLVSRNVSGLYNDSNVGTMGCGSQTPVGTEDATLFKASHPGARFGRNVPLEAVGNDEKRWLVPNPLVISRELLARNRPCFEATSVNLLVAAWIQFEVHDWFSHGEPVIGNEIEVPNIDQWGKTNGMSRVRRTRPDPTRHYEVEKSSKHGRCPMSFVSSESHWWDASQVYGANSERVKRLRANTPPGGILLDENGNLPNDNNSPQALTGFRANWWVGLSMLHTLFAKEHNAICEALHRQYPDWTAELIYTKARMINAALIAKIHTIEWTPALLQNPALDIAMNANWYGLFTKRFIDAFGRLGLNEAFWGIPGSGVDHHTADYALTEEFAAVYRLHPLMPDELKVLDYRDGSTIKNYWLPDDVVGPHGKLASLNHGFANLFYSFGHSHPGQLVLHNYPQFLRTLTRAATEETPEEVIDLAMIDILRDRERGVPRYNEMRRQLRMQPIVSFAELNKEEAANLRRIYGVKQDGYDNVEDLDLMIGMFAEAKPSGFAISDTAFRIFILMASRRLKSDRFIANDFRPEIYTPLGMDWVNRTTMSDILRRHYPELQPALYGVSNAFKPWK